MNEREISIRILNNFLKTLDLEGVCEFWVDEDSDVLMVYVTIDLDWLKKIQTKPGFVAKRIRDFVKIEIEKYTGLNVSVGSISKKC